jgi:hypothetical protein
MRIVGKCEFRHNTEKSKISGFFGLAPYFYPDNKQENQ